MRRVQDPNDKLSWLSITDILPSIAEASPDVFLLALENDLANDEPTVAILFEEFNDPLRLGPRVHYPALLRALELLCWNPEYVARSIRVLARLAAFPVPENFANTPLASMSTVMCGWLPGNQLDNGMRRELLDLCFQISPETARALVMELWPSRRSMVPYPYRPRYRVWPARSTKVTYGQLYEFVDILADKAIEWATDETSYLKWMIKAIETSTSIEASNKLVEYLAGQVTADALESSTRLDLLAFVSAAVVKHERHSDATWSMPIELRERLEDLRTLLDPTGLYSKSLFIFDWRPALAELDRSDSEYREELTQRQWDVVEQILASSSGWDVLEEITKRVKDSGSVGRAISFEEGFATLDRMTRWLESDDRQLRWAARVWVRSWLDSSPPETISAVLERETLIGEARKEFVHCVPHSGTYWDVLAAWPDEHTEYWQYGRFDIVDIEDLNRAVQELLRHGRGSTAAIIVAYALLSPSSQDREGVDVEVAVSSLHGALSAQDDLQRLDSYQVGEILDYLESKAVSQEILAGLEYAFFSCLEDFHEPKALNQYLATNPSLFVELTCQAYRGCDEVEHEPGEKPDPVKAQTAWSILNNWSGLPGRDDDGSVDPQTLEDWVTEARELLRESGRADIGDQLIGGTFVNASTGCDGIWPEEPIRDLVETLSSPHIETGMILGHLNSRGATSRGVYEGGGQERDLASRFLADSRSIGVRWPRTAAVLREIGWRYEQDAAREDLQAELAQDFD